MGTMAFAAAAVSAAVGFTVVTSISSTTAPVDLGGPVVVDPVPDATTSPPTLQNQPEPTVEPESTVEPEPAVQPGRTVQPPDPQPPLPRAEPDDDAGEIDDDDDDVDDVVDDDDGGDD
jgi:hypothetical protein